MTAGERLIEQGRQQGLQHEAQMLVRLLRQRFGDAVDPQVEQRVAIASVPQLETWFSRVLTTTTLAEALAD